MKLNFGGGPSQPMKSISLSSANAPIGPKEWEKIQRKKRKAKNLTPLPDTPRYLKKVAQERKALLQQQETQAVNSKESPIG